MEPELAGERIVEKMRRNTLLLLAVFFATAILRAQRPEPVAAPTTGDTEQVDKPLPSFPELLQDVERNEDTAEKMRRDYTYHVHQEEQDDDSKGNVKKTTVTDSESLAIDGVRVDRVVARDGKPLTAEETKKESERIDKEVAKDKERRAKLEDKGKATDSRGDQVLTVSRILELGSFSNERRVEMDGRRTIVADYAGDPKAKTNSEFEKVFRDLVGTVWIDEQDRVLVRGEGHFLNDFKIGAGLVLNIHKGLSFEFQAAKVNDEVWLPTLVEARGSARFLLFGGVNGHLKLVTSDYRKFRTSTTIIPSNRVIGANGQPVPEQLSGAQPGTGAQQPAPPQR